MCIMIVNISIRIFKKTVVFILNERMYVLIVVSPNAPYLNQNTKYVTERICPDFLVIKKLRTLTIERRSLLCEGLCVGRQPGLKYLDLSPTLENGGECYS